MTTRGPVTQESPVNMADVDTISAPPRPGPHRPAAAGTYELETPFMPRTAVVPGLEDVISSLDTSSLHGSNTAQAKPAARKPTSSSTVTSSSSESTPTDVRRQRGHTSRHETLPSTEALYTRRSRAVQKKQQAQQPADATPAHTATTAAPEDPLLHRMEEKEKEFDEKVKEIDRTFYRVGHQLVVRDDIIERLQRELDRLRKELAAASSSVGDGATSSSRPPVAPSTAARYLDWQQREQAMLDQLCGLASSLKEERDAARRERESAVEEVQQLRAALEAKQAEAAQHQVLIQQLTAKHTAEHAELREQKKQFRQQIEALRDGHQKDLGQLETHFRQLQARCTRAEMEREDMAHTGSATQAQLLELRLAADHHRQRDESRFQKLLSDHARLADEVEVAHLSTARLLQIMEQVPVLHDFLRWSELTHEFVFLGYPTRYFTGARARQGEGRDRGGEDDSWASRVDERTQSRRGRRQSPARRGASTPVEQASSPWYEEAASLAGLSRQTGVDDGVYGGTATAQETKNVWLNESWVASLQSIVQAENQFLRAKRIKLHEMEEAAQLTEQLPRARDVLECRQQDRDYWVPFAVFEEAQRFKNKFCPRVPAVSHFFPFLMQLNRIWHGRMQERVRVLKKKLQATQRELQRANAKYTRLTGSRSAGSVRDVLDRSASASRQTRGGGWSSVVASSGGGGGSSSRGPASKATLYTVSRAITAAEEEHYRLRRDVRLNVVSQGSLQLFHLYDAVVTRLLDIARETQTSAVETPHARGDGDGDDDDSALPWGERGPRPAVPSQEPPRWAPYGPTASRHHSDDDDDDEDDDEDDVLDVHDHFKSSASVPPLAKNASVTPPALPAVVQSEEIGRLRERVSAVSNHLLAQILACSQDLLELITSLRDRVEREVHGNDGGAGGPSSSLWMTSDEGSAGSEASSPTHALQKQIRDLLRAQYGESGIDRSRTASPEKGPRSPTAEPTRRGTAPSVAEQTLPHVMETVLDYSNEVRHIVLEAYETLQRLAHDRTMS